MGPLCDSCCTNTMKLNQQVSVMRKEIKNLRQMLDSATRANRKHMTAIQSVVSKIGHPEPYSEKIPSPQPPPSLPSPQEALEKGNIQTAPIGYISSCFSVKNATPRQPTVCGPSRAELQIQQSVFNNPGHALVGLEQYSHVWIIFLFHKNGHLNYKAKVSPPRLNGQRVGVYSTRSPHRPNALGLTLAKLDKIIGDTIHLSDVDMITGTPVLDIKPYIPEYDSPQTRVVLMSEPNDSNTSQLHSTAVPLNESTDVPNFHDNMEIDPQSGYTCDRTDNCDDNDLKIQPSREKLEACSPCQHSASVGAQFSLPKDLHSVLGEVKTFVTQGAVCQQKCETEVHVLESSKTKRTESTSDNPCYGEDAYSTIAGWIREPPVGNLDVRFTPSAERELAEFLPAHFPGSLENNRPQFRFLGGSEEAASAIRGVLAADPRSVYRRTRCREKLFFFTLDTADITCWFGKDFAEVLQVRYIEQCTAPV